MPKTSNELRKAEGDRPVPIGKPTKAEFMLRVNTVIELLCGGMTRHNIVQHAREKWGVRPNAADRYIRRAYAQLAKENEGVDFSSERGKAIRRLNLIFKQCLILQDYGRATAAQREINMLLGLHEPRKMIIKIELAERLQQHGLTASEALEMFLNELDRAKANA